jgi:hypothetical protein
MILHTDIPIRLQVDRLLTDRDRASVPERRVWLVGGRVLAARGDDISGRSSAAAILSYTPAPS